MDTDNLTEMAYQSIVLADYACDYLKAEIGAMCSEFKSEDEYLLAILKYVKSIEKNPLEYLDENNYIDEIELTYFKNRIKILREHIKKTLSVPKIDRGKTWDDELNS